MIFHDNENFPAQGYTGYNQLLKFIRKLLKYKYLKLDEGLKTLKT